MEIFNIILEQYKNNSYAFGMYETIDEIARAISDGKVFVLERKIVKRYLAIGRIGKIFLNEGPIFVVPMPKTFTLGLL